MVSGVLQTAILKTMAGSHIAEWRWLLCVLPSFRPATCRGHQEPAG